MFVESGCFSTNKELRQAKALIRLRILYGTINIYTEPKL